MPHLSVWGLRGYTPLEWQPVPSARRRLMRGPSSPLTTSFIISQSYTKDQAPSTKYQTPNTNTKHQTPNTKHQAPSTKHQTPNTKH